MFGFFNKKDERKVRFEPTLNYKPKTVYKSSPKKQERINILTSQKVNFSKKSEKVNNPFSPYRPEIRGITPENVLAMDAAPDLYDFPFNFNETIEEGTAFLGYQRLAQMASSRAEYHNIVSSLAEETTREWGEFYSIGKEDKKDKIAALEKEFKRLKVRELFNVMAEHDSIFGVGNLFVDLNSDNDSDISTPLHIEPEAITKGSLRGFVPVEPIWMYPSYYNSNDVLSDDFYDPDLWYANGRIVHKTRLMRFISREVNSILKPAYNFGGIPLIQMAKPYVDNWVLIRQSVADLINGCSIINLKTDLGVLQGMNGGVNGINNTITRIDNFNAFKATQQLFVTDKNEDLSILTTQLNGLGELENQALEQLCVVSKMPLVKLTGIQPAGLNASSDGEIRVWYDHVSAFQEKTFLPHLRKILRIVMLHLWGEIDNDIDFRFTPLWQADTTQEANNRKTRADTLSTYFEMGAITAEEVRKALANDEDSPLSGVDLTEEIEPETDDDVARFLNENEASRVEAYKT